MHASNARAASTSIGHVHAQVIATLCHQNYSTLMQCFGLDSWLFTQRMMQRMRDYLLHDEYPPRLPIFEYPTISNRCLKYFQVARGTNSPGLITILCALEKALFLATVVHRVR